MVVWALQDASVTGGTSDMVSNTGPAVDGANTCTHVEHQLDGCTHDCW